MSDQQNVSYLKRSIRLAYDFAVIYHLDPWELVLETIAEHAGDFEQHISEDLDITEDLRNWLMAEAQRPDPGPL